MVKQVRVDHRLLHGQVAVAWLQSLDIDCILIANDNVVNDDITKTTLKLAKPNNCKLVFKTVDDSIKAINDGVTDNYKLFIIFENITDALKVTRNTNVIKSINLGGTKHPDNSKRLSKSVSVTPDEQEDIRKIISEYPNLEIEIRALPNDQKIILKEI
ncbi:PTS sugar transporter subunit IIB [Brachyspira pulli]|uniref:PTS sugar transporter subunit IIB n=1 Tax=Brachyspira pulli TaxID=310721 RepID=UPI003005F99F